jgi:glycosyltransferase involved in cell wall biosynthesis
LNLAVHRKQIPIGDKTDPIIAEINANLGRPLRVLHIGNIANNAYNNARIQRQYGIDADVICYDYYHVMATPEWEDGGLTTRLDPFLPNWWASNLKGFKRPEWYVQGPLALCLDYLDARWRGQEVRQRLASEAIEDAYLDMLRRDALLHGRKWKDPRSFSVQNKWWPLPAIVRGMLSAFRRRELLCVRLSVLPVQLAGFAADLRQLVLWPLLAAAVSEPPVLAGAAFLKGLYRIGRRATGRSPRDDAAIAAMASRIVPATAHLTWLPALVRFLKLVARGMGAAALLPLVPLARVVLRRISQNELQKPRSVRFAEARRLMADLAGRYPELVYMPEIAPLLEQQIERALLFAPVLKHYDIVQGYSIDGFIPLVNGYNAFASYEHGTIRSIPFEKSITGVVCNITYRNSPVVFVTNTDVLPSVGRLKIDETRVYCIPHAFDERKLLDWRRENKNIRPPSDEIVFFHPTRQDWKDKDLSLTKGNDVMLRAAGNLWAQGHRFKLKLIAWGRDMEASKRLIEKLGYASAVEWIPPVGKQELWRLYCSSHAVIDQFGMDVMGGVGFEAMVLGVRLINAIDVDVFAKFFGEAPPFLGARSIAECEQQMKKIICDPQDLAEIGSSQVEWMKTYHSARRIVSIQAVAYEKLIASNADGS